MDKGDFPLVFPHPLENLNGLLAFGGDLSPERLLLAYRFGIFPWYSEGEPIMWWSLSPRLVLFPSRLKVSKSMRNYFNQNRFHVTVDQHFELVIRKCQQSKRKGQNGTWISEEMIDAYNRLHEMGHAHSVEVWEGESLVGGLYGVSLGKIFYGESMFSIVSNSSKYGFISLARSLYARGFELIDCQQSTDHLISLGAEEISCEEFMNLLRNNLLNEEYRGSWKEWDIN